MMVVMMIMMTVMVTLTVTMTMATTTVTVMITDDDEESFPTNQIRAPLNGTENPSLPFLCLIAYYSFTTNIFLLSCTHRTTLSR